MEDIHYRINTLEKNMNAMIPLSGLGLLIPVLPIFGIPLGLIYNNRFEKLKKDLSTIEGTNKKGLEIKIKQLENKRSFFYLPILPMLVWLGFILTVIIQKQLQG